MEVKSTLQLFPCADDSISIHRLLGGVIGLAAIAHTVCCTMSNIEQVEQGSDLG